jgi:hypothetical protein
MHAGAKSGIKASPPKVNRSSLRCFHPLTLLTAIQGYDPRITKAINLLLSAIDRQLGQPLDVSQWFSFFVFDVMEDLAFNKSSNMLANGKEAYIFKTIRTDMYNIAFFTHLPWLLPFLKRTPVLNWNYYEFLDWIQKLIDERKQASWPLLISRSVADTFPERARAARHLLVDSERPQ